jgi:predicted RNase H-like HicB family nuclease
MTLSVQCERDEDGRWLAKMPGAIAYGETIEEAMAKVEALALQAAAEQVEGGRTSRLDASDAVSTSGTAGQAPTVDGT